MQYVKIWFENVWVLIHYLLKNFRWINLSKLKTLLYWQKARFVKSTLFNKHKKILIINKPTYYHKFNKISEITFWQFTNYLITKLR